VTVYGESELEGSNNTSVTYSHLGEKALFSPNDVRARPAEPRRVTPTSTVETDVQCSPSFNVGNLSVPSTPVYRDEVTPEMATQHVFNLKAFRRWAHHVEDEPLRHKVLAGLHDGWRSYYEGPRLQFQDWYADLTAEEKTKLEAQAG
jgi:hypothetical protein